MPTIVKVILVVCLVGVLWYAVQIFRAKRAYRGYKNMRSRMAV